MRQRLGTCQSHSQANESEPGFLQPLSGEMRQPCGGATWIPSGAAHGRQLRLMAPYELFELTWMHFLVLILSAVILLE